MVPADLAEKLNLNLPASADELAASAASADASAAPGPVNLLRLIPTNDTPDRFAVPGPVDLSAHDDDLDPQARLIRLWPAANTNPDELAVCSSKVLINPLLYGMSGRGQELVAGEGFEEFSRAPEGSRGSRL
ncbi:hypothetical protein OPT61_g3770 [Boeremia exigua]|uniref:Uncharacterized protein n=1 Tax=Boeremia exigua TaxID=749465 RepID=A0ACC2IGI7_9PLEO|nr:hypothetical protein OPT61_g3770 [Boeremia exigua]